MPQPGVRCRWVPLSFAKAKSLGEATIGAKSCVAPSHMQNCWPSNRRLGILVVGVCPDCQLYVTLEPCVMCVGAIVQARMGRLVFGCLDPKGGAVESLYQLCDDSRLNHRLPVAGGMLAEDCSAILEDFLAV